MKTTVDIPQSLLEEAKRLAADHRTTVRALVEEGLRRVIDEHQRTGMFRLLQVLLRGASSFTLSLIATQSETKEAAGRPPVGWGLHNNEYHRC